MPRLDEGSKREQLLWNRRMIAQYNDCARRLDGVIEGQKSAN